MIHKTNQKRLITNEEIFESIQGFKSEIFESLQGLKTDVSNLKKDFKDLRQSTVDGFDKVFHVIDDARNESKRDIFEFRKDVNQRFTVIENRLSNIEDNMVYKHELSNRFV